MAITTGADMFRNLLDKFIKCESGATTVDWVVLTGLIILVTLVVTPGFISELQAAGATIGTDISEAPAALLGN